MGAFGVVLTSVITSTAMTVVLLAVTGNLGLDRGKPEAPAPVQRKLVPSLIGLPLETAQDLLLDRRLRLEVKAKRADESAPRGAIVEQTPKARGELRIGGTVVVIVSSGVKMLKVPALKGKSIETARELLVAAGFEVGGISDKGEGAPGTVTDSKPRSGAKVTEGSAVDLVVVPAGVPVPELVGLRTRAAKKAIKEAGFKLGKIKWKYNEHKPANLVLGQDPEAGATAPLESKINLVLNEE